MVSLRIASSRRYLRRQIPCADAIHQARPPDATSLMASRLSSHLRAVVRVLLDVAPRLVAVEANAAIGRSPKKVIRAHCNLLVCEPNRLPSDADRHRVVVCLASEFDVQ
jgi:hypothetical protein